ncbi:hypothetical protein WH47_09466 [Habropoda laboriosa]|uniref:Uncharacterized protein n=1 Tax=Habropoda laboriosa TaxID=597456 RepID=A0A0L7QIV0_9HYME|nr:hypothetical protein WH47_09466 [Habropoda laboriosa]
MNGDWKLMLNSEVELKLMDFYGDMRTVNQQKTLKEWEQIYQYQKEDDDLSGNDHAHNYLGCLTENVFEYPELINPYCLLHPKLISTTVTEIETKELEYSVVADMIKDFTDIGNMSAETKLSLLEEISKKSDSFNFSFSEIDLHIKSFEDNKNEYKDYEEFQQEWFTKQVCLFISNYKYFKEVKGNLLAELSIKNLTIQDWNDYIKMVESNYELKRNDTILYGCDCGCGGEYLDFEEEELIDNELKETIDEIYNRLNVAW